ncbi:Rho termination factor N-terminal domain-containing protein, partial [Dactylosporangium siamense]
MSDTTDVTSDISTGRATAEAGATTPRRAGTGLARMLVPELQSLAAALRISGTARMRKGELVTAIQARQDSAAPGVEARTTTTEAPPARPEKPLVEAAGSDGPPAVQPAAAATETPRPERNGGPERTAIGEQIERADAREQGERAGGDRNQRGNVDQTEDDGIGGRGRRNRSRDRRRGRDRDGAETSAGRAGNEPQVSDDDVLVPVAGILDVLDNYAFVRTTGYLSGS